MLSDRDVRRWVGAGMPGVHVAHAMARDVLSVRPTTLAHEAAAVMLDHKVGGLPVIDDDGRLVGILTETDLVRVAHRVLGGA
jgi:CBS domain-containing protein